MYLHVPWVYIRVLVGFVTQSLVFWKPSWSWSYDSWIYNYLCNQCISPLMLRVRT